MNMEFPAGTASVLVPHPRSEPAAVPGTAPAQAGDPEHLLVAEVAALREVLKRRTDEVEQACLRVAHADLELRALSAQQVLLEEEKSSLARLYAAATLLHGSLDAGEVLAAVREVVVNLLGSEEFAVLEIDSGRTTLTPLAWMGIDVDRLRHLRMADGPVGAALRTATPCVREGTPHDEGAGGDDVLACIPLLLAGAVYGVVVVYSLLPQKECFTPSDNELFELLGRHAAIALYTARLHHFLHRAQRPG